MATATLVSSAEEGERKLSLYQLDMPVFDIAGDETMVVLVSQLPEGGGGETAVFPVFPCPVHILHESIFAIHMQNEMCMDKCTDAEALERLGYSVA